jgi:hypothetical protein
MTRAEYIAQAIASNPRGTEETTACLTQADRNAGAGRRLLC